ncbi:MAG: hypothetical protein ACYTBJ_18900 [Planctomycetota bacterium]
MMKETGRIKSFVFRLLTFAFSLGALVFLLCGCGPQPGETAAEAHRRRQRVLRINQQEMIADIDAFWLLNEPSKMTDRRVP